MTNGLLLKRENLHQQALKALGILVEGYLAQAQFDKVQTYAKKLLELEPWHEKTHRHLMTALVLSGQREAAIMQYEACRHVLWEEMGLEPGTETAVLYQKIVDNEPIEAPSTTPRHTASNEHRSQLPKHNLPSTLTPYFGREAELKQLTQLLLNPDTRFVTLLGEGGVGKTRLSQEVARRVLNGFADGVWFVQLASISPSTDSGTTQDDIATAVAQAINHSLSGNASPKTQLINVLKSRHLLLILDNFEHILDGADLVYDLLEETTAVSILCSSRIPLGFMAEYLVPISQLPLPKLSEQQPLAADAPTSDYSRFASVQLFADRARRMTGWFALDKDNQEQVANLCHLVAGNPLGIELAAASLKQRTLPETIAAIQQSLDTVAARFRDIPERHRSMRAVFENSWALLTLDEQRLLAQLSRFRGGFLPKAVKAITGAGSSTLVKLQTHSLLTVGDGRYTMHELLRQFAAEKLLDQFPRVGISQKHSHYFLDFLAERELSIAGEAPQIPAGEITADLDNIRQAWQVATENRDVAHLLGGLNTFADYLQLRGRYREAERVFGNTARQLDGMDGGEETAVVTTRLMVHQTAALVRLSRYDNAITLAQKCTQKAKQSHDTWSQGYAHLHWGEALWREGNYPLAKTHLLSSLQIAEIHNLERLQGSVNFHLNIVHYYFGDYEAAKKYVSSALAIWSRLKNTRQRSYSSNSLGLIHFRLKNIEESQPLFELTLSLAKQIGDQQAQVSALNNLSMIATDKGNYSNAEDYLRECLAISLSTGDKSSEASAQYNLGWNAIRANQFNTARRFLAESNNLYKEIKDSRGESLVFSALGHIAIGEKDYDTAQNLYQKALDIATQIGHVNLMNEIKNSINQHFNSS